MLRRLCMCPALFYSETEVEEWPRHDCMAVEAVGGVTLTRDEFGERNWDKWGPSVTLRDDFVRWPVMGETRRRAGRVVASVGTESVEKRRRFLPAWCCKK